MTLFCLVRAAVLLCSFPGALPQTFMFRPFRPRGIHVENIRDALRVEVV